MSKVEINQKYGKLTTIEKMAGSFWVCKCSCGNSAKVRQDSLKSGATKSCGCLGKRHLTGKQFGRLKVLELDSIRSGKKLWKCLCRCGSNVVVQASDLISGHTQSCGCLSREVARKTSTTHGMSRTPTYICWINMLSRCNDEKNKSFFAYGGRGINVCPRWDPTKGGSFENFLEDMGVKPESKTIERIDVNGGYSPSNCTWATNYEQARNKRKHIYVNVEGETFILSDAAKKLGIHVDRLSYAIKKYGDNWKLHIIEMEAQESGLVFGGEFRVGQKVEVMSKAGRIYEATIRVQSKKHRNSVWVVPVGRKTRYLIHKNQITRAAAEIGRQA